MQVTSPYWFQPEFEPTRTQPPITDHLGFTRTIPSRYGWGAVYRLGRFTRPAHHRNKPVGGVFCGGQQGALEWWCFVV